MARTIQSCRTHDFVDMLDLRVGGDVAVIFEEAARL